MLILLVVLCAWLVPVTAATEAAQRSSISLLRAVSPEVVKAVSPLIAHDRTETLFYETLELLTDKHTPLDGAARRDVLRQVSTLVESRWELDRHRSQLGSVLPEASLDTLEAELAGLQKRQEQAPDRIARESLRQCADLCASRLQSARALHDLHHRLDAQGEVVHQALATVHFALVRLRAAPASLAAPHLADIRQTVARIESQTRAIEAAAEEVRALRS